MQYESFLIMLTVLSHIPMQQIQHCHSPNFDPQTSHQTSMNMDQYGPITRVIYVNGAFTKTWKAFPVLHVSRHVFVFPLYLYSFVFSLNHANFLPVKSSRAVLLGVTGCWYARAYWRLCKWTHSKAGWPLSRATTAAPLHSMSSQAVTPVVDGSACVLCWQWISRETPLNDLVTMNIPFLKPTQTPVKYLLAFVTPSLFFLWTSLKWRWRVRSLLHFCPQSVQLSALCLSSLASVCQHLRAFQAFWDLSDLGGMLTSYFHCDCQVRWIQNSLILLNNWGHKTPKLVTSFLKVFHCFLRFSWTFQETPHHNFTCNR